jgi:molybdopterin-biosynthesis enzyme MoeA-like protein
MKAARFVQSIMKIFLDDVFVAVSPFTAGVPSVLYTVLKESVNCLFYANFSSNKQHCFGFQTSGFCGKDNSVDVYASMQQKRKIV